ncbi:MAG: hypothetical protein HYS57_01545 [Parcubacteria group bacterium]|nr:hypothetical protein [Parcubacteria group bacterium]
MIQKAKKLYEALLAQPESVRRTIATVLVILSVPLVVGIWFQSLRTTFGREEKVAEKRESPRLVRDFKKGTANVREALGEIDLNPFRKEIFRPRKREVMPRTRLPVQKSQERR